MFQQEASDAGQVSGGVAPVSGLNALLEGVRSEAAALASVAVGGVDYEVSDGIDSQSAEPVAGGLDRTGTGLVELLTALSELSSAVEAAAARACVELDRVRRAHEAERGVPAARRGGGVAAEVGLARRESGARGRSFLGFSKVMCLEMPHTLAELAGGRLTPWRAMLLARESACLDLEDRQRLDEELCADPSTLAGLGDRAVAAKALQWCAKEDPASVVERRSRAEHDRRVSLRPAPDMMAQLSALLPVAEGVAAFAALSKHADSARSSGDSRTRGQVMADALVARVTGQAEGAAPGVLVNLVMTDRALFTSADDEPAELPGYGPVPAAVARDLVDLAGGGAGPGAWLRRVYVAPQSGALVQMDSRQRKVPQGLKDFVRLRDGGSCRMLWCDAPARHTDHVVDFVKDGRTRGQGLQATCEGHNYGKQALGWVAESSSGGGAPAGEGLHTVVTQTPSGHRYVSIAPPLPGRWGKQSDPPSAQTGPPVDQTGLEGERDGPRQSRGDPERAGPQRPGGRLDPGGTGPPDWSDGERRLAVLLGRVA